MVLNGPWWDRIVRGVSRKRMPGGDPNSPVPIPVQLGIPLNEYMEDLSIWAGANLAKYEEVVAYGAARVIREHSTLALARIMLGEGTITQADRIGMVTMLEQSILGMRPDMDKLIEVSLGNVVEHQAYIAGEFQDVWSSYRNDLGALPPWRVPPVGGFRLAVQATDPEWFLRGLVDNLQQGSIIEVRKRALAAYLSGESVPSFAASIRKHFKNQRNEHMRVARTSLHRVARGYQKELYKENDVVSGEKFVATLDSRTCPVCGNYDGRRYDVGEGPVVPLHDYCRCTYSPVVKSVRELLGMPPEEETEDHRRVRASMDGKVPLSTRWPDWLARKEAQHSGFAKNVLGATRYDAWKAGDLTLGDLSKGGRQPTLAQLGIIG